MTRTIVLNTLVYKQVFKENPSISQADMLSDIKSLGFQYVEVRREYFKAGNEEMKKTAAKAGEEQLKLYYSIPDELFKGNEVNPVLEQYFQEARILNASQIKLSLGEMNQLTEQAAGQIRELINKYAMKLLIENDQSKEKSSSQKLSGFMEQAVEFNLPIGLTFDIGNFVHVGEDPSESAKILKPYVQYVHLKNVKKKGETAENTDLESGDFDIQSILNEFPETLPCAFEYSCGELSGINEKLAHEKHIILGWGEKVLN